MSESRDVIKRKIKEIDNFQYVNKSSRYITRAAKAANSSATTNNKSTTRKEDMPLSTSNQVSTTNNPRKLRPHRVAFTDAAEKLASTFNNSSKQLLENVTTKKQKTEDEAYKHEEDHLSEFNSGSNVPKKSRKKKGKRGKDRHPNMTTEKRRERSLTNHQNAKAGVGGSGVLAKNDKATITRGGSIEFLLFTGAFISLRYLKAIEVRAARGSERYEKIAITSGAVAQEDSGDAASALFTAIKLVRTPESAAEGHLTSLSKWLGLSFKHMSHTLSRDDVRGEPHIHPYSENAKGRAGRQKYDSNHYTFKAHIFFISNFQRETVPFFFGKGDTRTLTSVLKLNGNYNLEYIETLNKKVTKPRIILALLLEHFGVDYYNSHKSEMNIETLGRIMEEAVDEAA